MTSSHVLNVPLHPFQPLLHVDARGGRHHAPNVALVEHLQNPRGESDGGEHAVSSQDSPDRRHRETA